MQKCPAQRQGISWKCKAYGRFILQVVGLSADAISTSEQIRFMCVLLETHEVFDCEMDVEAF